MKYIIEIAKEYEDSFKGLMILGAKDSNLFVDTLAVEDLEELNSDYINEHFSDLQDTVYQRGLDDAWEAARKIAQQWEEDTDSEHRVVIDDSIRVTLDSMTASEAIAKLKAYEEKADDSIIAGDEVKAEDGTAVFFVTWMSDRCICGIDKEGRCYSYEPKEICGKTGNHYNVVFEEMRE